MTNPLLVGIGAFLLGGVPFGFLAGRLKGIDIREHGSRNIGATNTLRVLGVGPGIVVLLLDVLKGLVPVLLARQAGLSAGWVAGIGLLAILGHTYSPFLRFRGGKGIATSLGVLLGLSPVVALASLAVFLIIVAATRYVSLGSLLATLTQALLFFVLPHPLPYRLLGLLAALFVFVKHRANIERLRSGTESQIGEKKDRAL